MYSSNAAFYRRLPVKSSMSVCDFDNQVFPAHINRNLTQLPDGQRTWLEAGDIMIDSPFCIHEVRIPKPVYFSNDYITVDLGYFKECCGRLAAAVISAASSVRTSACPSLPTSTACAFRQRSGAIRQHPRRFPTSRRRQAFPITATFPACSASIRAFPRRDISHKRCAPMHLVHRRAW